MAAFRGLFLGYLFKLSMPGAQLSLSIVNVGVLVKKAGIDVDDERFKEVKNVLFIIESLLRLS